MGDEDKLPYRIDPAIGWFSIDTDYTRNNMLYLDPGVYYINSIYLTGKSVGAYLEYRVYEAPGMKDQIIYYGAFKVKAGDVLNLGKLLIPSFKVTDDTKVIKEQLGKSAYASLLQKMTPGFFYERGSIAHLNKNNQVEFIDSNTVERMKRSITNKMIQECKK